MRILVIHGPNLNLLGKRDPAQYGILTQEDIISQLAYSYPDDKFELFQSNLEGEIVDKLQKTENYDGILINPGGYSHTSVAIHDALQMVSLPKVEVHLSHLAQREEFRQIHITAKACNGYLSGFKEHGYIAGVLLLKRLSLSAKPD